MKKLIAILVVIALIGGGFYLFVSRNDSPQAPDRDSTTTEPTSGRDPSNATFTIDGESITLSSGRSESAIPGSAIVEETVLMDKFAYGDLNGDDKEDTALLLVRYGGGSGTFIYAGAYVSGPVNYKGTDAIFLGDRIAPQSVSISNGVMTVNFLDREADAPLSDEPTIPRTAQFVYKDGEFQER